MAVVVAHRPVVGTGHLLHILLKHKHTKYENAKQIYNDIVTINHRAGLSRYFYNFYVPDQKSNKSEIKDPNIRV